MFNNYPYLPWAILAALFAAGTAIFGKMSVEKLDPDLTTLYRTLVILPILLALTAIKHSWISPFRLTPQTFTCILLSGITACLSWICYFRAMKLGNASVVAPLDKLSVVLVAILSVSFLGERLHLGQWLGVLLILLGSLCLTFFQRI